MFGFTASPCASCSPQEVSSGYQSVFCGLSCALSKEYSPLARFLVNRDSTFLSLVGASLQDETPSLTTRTCCNPFSTAKPLLVNNAVMEYSAAVTICGLTAKLEDDKTDEKGLRRNFSKLLLSQMGGFTDKAVSLLNALRFPTAEVQEALLNQSMVEKGSPSPEEAAAPTAHAYGEIFKHLGVVTGKPSDKLADLGKHLGRLIYWRDAYDDVVEDEKKGSFNLLRYTPLEELQVSARSSINVLENSLKGLPLQRNQSLLPEVLSATSVKHQDFFSYSYEEEAEKERKRREEGYGNWCKRQYDTCCNLCDCLEDCVKCCRSPRRNCSRKPCGQGNGNCCIDGCCDATFDCGPGDSGCCDCGDCCSCN